MSSLATISQSLTPKSHQLNNAVAMAVTATGASVCKLAWTVVSLPSICTLHDQQCHASSCNSSAKNGLLEADSCLRESLGGNRVTPSGEGRLGVPTLQLLQDPSPTGKQH